MRYQVHDVRIISVPEIFWSRGRQRFSIGRAGRCWRGCGVHGVLLRPSSQRKRKQQSDNDAVPHLDLSEWSSISTAARRAREWRPKLCPRSYPICKPKEALGQEIAFSVNRQTPRLTGFLTLALIFPQFIS